MMEKGEHILVGARIMMDAMGIEHAAIGIENNKKDAIDYLKENCTVPRSISPAGSACTPESRARTAG